MDLRAKIAEAMYQRPASEYADSRRVDAVMEVIEEHEQQVQRLERLLGQLTKISEEHRMDLETAARSMRDRALQAISDAWGTERTATEMVRALPLLTEEDE